MYFLRFKEYLINSTADRSAYSKSFKSNKNLDFQLKHFIIPAVKFHVSVTFLNECNQLQMSQWLMVSLTFTQNNTV